MTAPLLEGRAAYRCGAQATVRYPADHPEILARFTRMVAARDCPACTGGLPPQERARQHVLGDPPFWWISREREAGS